MKIDIIKMGKDKYARLTDKMAGRSPIFRNCLNAFWTGGLICCIAQGLRDIFSKLLDFSNEDAGVLTSAVLVFFAALFTGLGWFPKIAKKAGAGTLVPITGFANSIASPAIDSKSEGLILGVGAKIFNVAGPVLLYGTLAGSLYGTIYYISGLLFS